MDSTTIPGGSNLPGRDNQYYFEPIIFQVEDSLFKVPRYHFIHGSEVFNDMISLPQPSGSEREGDSDLKPLLLNGVSKVDFQRLLKVMYPLTIYPPQKYSSGEWVSALKLSTMWRLLEIRKLAIERLTAADLECVEKIVLGNAYQIPQWLREGYEEMVRRVPNVTEEEQQKIGRTAAMRIRQVRKAYWRDINLGFQYSIDFDLAFSEQVKDARVAYAEYN